ncbi:MAG: hypothetical protein AABY15_07650 [Nanoarchaeota archaeon]
MRKKKPTRKRLVKLLDQLQTKILKEIYDSCVQCGSTKQLGTGHIFSRRVYATRWDFVAGGNAYLQCWGDNFRHTRDQWPYINWYQNLYGGSALIKLRKRYDNVKPVTTPQLEDLLISMQRTFKDLVNNIGE